MEDNAPPPADREPGLPASAGRAADEREDPDLDALAALEMQVDNWLSPPVKVEAVPPEPGPPPAELRQQSELRQRSEPPQQPVQPPVEASGLPRGLKRALLVVLGLGAVGASIGAAMFLNAQNQAGGTRETVASSTRSTAAVAAVQAPVALPTKPDPVPLVFLDEAESGRAVAAVAPPAQPPVKGNKARAGATKNVAPKKVVVREKKAAVVARRWPSEPPGRRMTDAERVEDAVARCRATSTRPGGCNIRVCDVLGSTHPACRE